MSHAVLADPQANIARILRPYDGYADHYNGKSCAIPIMLTEDGQPYDPMGGQPGYSRYLARGIPVAFGQRIVLWMPLFERETYQWVIYWRLRSLADYRRSRIPWSLPRTAEGVPDNDEDRVVVPCALQTIIYAPTELSLLSDSLQPQNVHAEGPVFQQLPALPLPLGPGLPVGMSGALLSQGIFPRVSMYYGRAVWAVFECQALGNELLLGFTRYSDTEAHPTWEFSVGVDEVVKQFFSASDAAGVYVIGLVAP